ncbi:uncharacterized protein N7483_005201 [Penicillium malachiteum]|uniref:uncharacterized protein n=1 Tax=Penicillium malachiteum TaxID=1324776 RepID=UPI002548BEC1|nr:uncharacterized protein N7483_005201 [Penicillium malachiteum]KAJ5730693.1 hypothetical protein N7483_005201 [Penicillium malachiteum]
MANFEQSTWKPRGRLGAAGSLSDDQPDIDTASNTGALEVLTLASDSSGLESDFDSFASRLGGYLEYMRENLIKSQQQRAELMNLVTSLQLPEPQPDLDYQLARLEISNLITTGMNHLALEQYHEAEEEINRALDMAEQMNEGLDRARCYYWLGRIQVEQRNFSLAYQYFRDAQPLLIDGRCLESHSLKFYLEFAKSGGSEKIPLPFSDPLHVNLGVELTTNDSIEESKDLSKKRKWDSQSWSRVLRLSNSPRHTLKSTNRLNMWTVLDAEDYIHPDSSLRSFRMPSKPELNLCEFQWASQAGSRPPQLESFKFRCYPRGLTSRTRNTKIFDEQPGENIMSADEWDVLQQHAKNKKVTLAYLANERRKCNDTDKRK